MAQYLITYDNHPPRNYAALYQLMKQWNAVKLADSVWLANLKGPASEVRRFVMTTMQRNDTVAVLQLQPGSDWATNAVSPIASTWLSTFIRRAQAAA
ncbi:hypothetical protein [uncultured Novosphingobium sp.]|uniref:hypothetical protein n=1 Tax=uncultured Novosphingobium sp. TaxID=292277 RepID=UPI003748994F